MRTVKTHLSNLSAKNLTYLLFEAAEDVDAVLSSALDMLWTNRSTQNESKCYNRSPKNL